MIVGGKRRRLFAFNFAASDPMVFPKSGIIHCARAEIISEFSGRQLGIAQGLLVQPDPKRGITIVCRAAHDYITGQGASGAGLWL